MAQDLNKHLERARRSLEKNKLREAVTEYQAVLEEVPTNTEALQALADIYTRLSEPALAAQYYGIQFDRLVEGGDGAKASAIFLRFLRPFPQPPDRLMRYGTLLQKQNRTSEAIEQFTMAATLFQTEQRGIEALACYEAMAVLDPENPQRHIVLGEAAEALRIADLATRSFLRAGQLLLGSNALDSAVEYFGRAYQISPQDRIATLLFAEGKLRKGDAESAALLLEPMAAQETESSFLALYGEALLRTGRLDQAKEQFEAYYKQKPEGFTKFFELAAAYVRMNEDAKAAAVLVQTKETMRTLRKDGEFAIQADRLATTYPDSLPVAEVVAKLYEELNRETKYFDALVRLFDLYLIADQLKHACETLDRLVDIDPYDYRNQERIAKLEGRAEQALEDLIVQVEIFLQYSLQSKAVERLERIAELFPGEEDKNERLRALYERANWWPKGAPRKTVPKLAATPAPSMEPPPRQQPAQRLEAYDPPAGAVPSPADTHRDLAAIAEINRLMYRQATPRDVLLTTASGVGKHLMATRCLIAVGAAGDGMQLTSEYSSPGVPTVGAGKISNVVGLISKVTPDSLGGFELHASSIASLRDVGLESALGVMLTDKETQAQSGALLIGDAKARKWKPNESFFLQAVGDQLVLSVNHTRLRSLVRSLAVADEKTGLLSRGAYI